MENIAVVGTGLVGCGWAIVFARAGKNVRLYDHKKEAVINAMSWISDRLKGMQEIGLIDNASAVFERISASENLKSAVESADYIQESVLEITEVKQALFTEMDGLIKEDAIIGSSTSGIPASAFTGHIRNRSRCMVVHPVNPPYLIPVVELVAAPWTDAAVAESVRALMSEIGQKPVVVNKEIDGFVLNRLQGVLLMEAWRLVEEGVISVADLDLTVSHGLGLRWAFMGPFESIDLNAEGGVADYARRLGPLYHRIASSRETFSVWDESLIAEVESQRREQLPIEGLKERSSWRDLELMQAALRRRGQNGANTAD